MWSWFTLDFTVIQRFTIKDIKFKQKFISMLWQKSLVIILMIKALFSGDITFYVGMFSLRSSKTYWNIIECMKMALKGKKSDFHGKATAQYWSLFEISKFEDSHTFAHKRNYIISCLYRSERNFQVESLPSLTFSSSRSK